MNPIIEVCLYFLAFLAVIASAVYLFVKGFKKEILWIILAIAVLVAILYWVKTVIGSELVWYWLSVCWPWALGIAIVGLVIWIVKSSSARPTRSAPSGFMKGVGKLFMLIATVAILYGGFYLVVEKINWGKMFPESAPRSNVEKIHVNVKYGVWSPKIEIPNEQYTLDEGEIPRPIFIRTTSNNNGQKIYRFNGGIIPDLGSCTYIEYSAAEIGDEFSFDVMLSRLE